MVQIWPTLLSVRYDSKVKNLLELIYHFLLLLILCPMQLTFNFYCS